MGAAVEKAVKGCLETAKVKKLSEVKLNKADILVSDRTLKRYAQIVKI